jgi:hypothetical protein
MTAGTLAGMEPVRMSRRTSVITLFSHETGHTDVIRSCEPECRNEILLDLGVPHTGHGGWVYRSHGEADVTVAWSGVRYHVTWKRVRPSALSCDHCEDGWMYRMPELVARAAEQSAARKGVAVPQFAARAASSATQTAPEILPG